MVEFDASGDRPVPHRLREQIFRGSDAVAEGLISSTRLRREFLRILHGFYVPPGTHIDHGVKTLAAVRALPDQATLTAHSSAWWYGVEYAETIDPVVVILPHGVPVKGPSGVKVHQTNLNETEVDVIGGLRLASPTRTAWDSAVLTTPRTALAIVDGLLRRSVVTKEQLRAVLTSKSGLWGVSRARIVLELANGASESAGESWTRWLLHQASIPPAVLQFEVLDAQGRFVARVDFGWPDCRVALEYDGAYHADPLQQIKDRERDAALRALGWTVIHMTTIDLRDPGRVLQDLRRALTP